MVFSDKVKSQREKTEREALTGFWAVALVHMGKNLKALSTAPLPPLWKTTN